MRVAVANLKGGTGKTTTAVYLAQALAAGGGSTLLVDADPQGSALRWAESAEEMPFPAVAMPVVNLHRQLASMADRYDHLVIDTPPGHTAIVASALRSVELVVIPLAPTVMDVDRLQATLQLVEEARVLNDELQVRILLTRTRKGTRSRRDIREVLDEDDLPVLQSEIPQRETIAFAAGSLITDLGEYSAVLDELKATA